MSHRATDTLEAVSAATAQFRDVRLQHWLHHDLFSAVWWLLVALTIFPWIVWWKLADKHRLVELVCFGALTAVICVSLDAVGTVNLWWVYNVELVIHFPGLLVADISDIPVVYMLVYQYCSSWNSFCIAMVFVSISFAYVVEPAFRWLGIYQSLTWEHFYSMIFYFAMAILIRLVALTMKRRLLTG